MKLKEIHLQGYKSIDGQSGQTIPFGDVTVLLGVPEQLVVVVKRIGLPTLRQKCLHFNDWLTRLEQLARVTP